MFRWLIFFILLAHLPLAGKGSTDYQTRIDKLAGLPKPLMVDSVMAIISDLVLESEAVNLHYNQKMLQLKEDLSAESYLMILSHLAETVERDNQALLDHSISFALENGLHQYLGSLYLLKTRFFRQESMYDSAMIYTLRARENIEKYYNVEDEANVLHLLGDLYYSTGLYDIARDYYLMVNEVKGTQSEWNGWRRRVIRNNLAQIEMKKGNHYLALIMFQESLTELGDLLTSKFDSVAAAYILFMMADNYLFLENHKHAESFADSSLNYYNHLHHAKGLFDVSVIKAQLAVNEHNAQKASSWLDSVLVYARKFQIGPGERSKLLLLQSNVHQLNNEPGQALEIMNQYVALQDSINKNLSAARIQQIQSENQFDALNLKYASIRKQRTLYLALFVALAVIVIITVMFVIRNKQKNRRLVALSVDVVKHKHKEGRIDANGVLKPDLRHKNADPEKSELIMSFMDLMKSKKLYLDSNISLQKVAQELGTNRSYLSKAINEELDQGFSATVNSLRIQEAIKLIAQRSDGEKISISGLAADTGFNSRTSFTAAFSNHTGMLPSSFISNYKSLYGIATPPQNEKG